MDLNDGKRINTSTIKSLMKKCVPDRVHISTKDSVNFRHRKIMYLKKLKEVGESLDSIKFNHTSFKNHMKKGGLDNKSPQCLDKSI